jgi:signal transduction histidine kinase
MLAGPDAARRLALAGARERTDAAAAIFRTSVASSSARRAATDLAEQRMAELAEHLDRLPLMREAVDAARVSRVHAVDAYTDAIAVAYQIFAAISFFDDRDIDTHLSHLLTLSRGRELLAQEDALMSGVLASGTFTDAEAVRLIEIVGAQRLVRSLGVSGLDDEVAVHGPVLAGPAMAELRLVEDVVVAQARGGAAPAVEPGRWRSAVDGAATVLAKLDIDLAEATIARATVPAIWIVVRLVLAAGLGLIALIASIVMSVTTARALVMQLRRLRDAATDLATVRLPAVVQRLSAGEDIDVAAEAPPLAFGNDEIGQVGWAFTLAQQTAVRVAVEQAQLRRSVRDVFVSLARRSQTLVHRQLRILDAMESRTVDAAELEDLFRVDQLATRMRRNAENLIVLSGAAPGRGWRHAVPVMDVLRSAVSEVEDFARISLGQVDAAQLAGMVVSDVVHLLAELMENALNFSPPQSGVRVNGRRLAQGYLVEIEDDGLGMTDAELADANEQLTHPPAFTLSSTVRLGLYVVGRLAQRHQVQVRLRRHAAGGTAAEVRIPANLISSAQILLDPADHDDWQPQRVEVAVGVAAAPTRTASGLPVRQRQPLPAPAEDSDFEKARRLMQSYQSGTQRARTEAVQWKEGDENKGDN